MANNASISNISIDLTELSSDTSPQLGGNLDLNSNNITGTGNINTTGTITSSGTITGNTFSGSGASLTNIPAGQLTGALPAISGANLTGINTDLVSDTTPQLGGNLDLNSNNITGTGNIETTGSIDITGGMNLTNDTFVGWGGGSQRPAITGNKSDNDMDFYTGGSKQMALTTTYLNLYNSLYLSTGSNIQFEGSSANSYETTLGVTNPTADRTITLPDSTGTVRVGYQPGEVIEEINAICDGSTVVVQSGSYTMTNVTGVQNGSTSYATVNGSSISYTPPAGTKRVYYRFWYHYDVTENSGISHHIMQIDGTDVYGSANNVASNYASSNWHHACFPISVEYTIDCDASSTNANAGQFTSWTSAKTLRVRYREYSGSYESRLHYNTWWNGTGASGNYTIMKPHLTIRAIA